MYSHQSLYYASELQAAGLRAGDNITSLSVRIAERATVSYNKYVCGGVCVWEIERGRERERERDREIEGEQ